MQKKKKKAGMNVCKVSCFFSNMQDNIDRREHISPQIICFRTTTFTVK